MTKDTHTQKERERKKEIFKIRVAFYMSEEPDATRLSLDTATAVTISECPCRVILKKE